MQLTLVRHTSVDVSKGICYGVTDVQLASTFLSEVEQIRLKLKGKKYDAAFSSPLTRCTSLAAQILPENDIQVDQRLIELDFGDWEMVTWDSIFASSEGKRWFANYVNITCPNGESYTDLIKRAELFLDTIRQSSYERVLVFTHAGFIRAMTCLLQHKTPEQAFYTPLEYGQISHFNLERK